MSTKRDKQSLPDPKDQRIAELEAQLAQAQAIIQNQQKPLERLQAEVEALRRAGKRQATPFARRKRVAVPKKPGRKAGQGKFARREKPAAKDVQETKIAPLQICPECGGSLSEMREHEQYVADIPVVEPVITRYCTGTLAAPGADFASERGSWRVGGATCQGIGGRSEASPGGIVRQSERSARGCLWVASDAQRLVSG